MRSRLLGIKLDDGIQRLRAAVDRGRRSAKYSVSRNPAWEGPERPSLESRILASLMDAWHRAIFSGPSFGRIYNIDPPEPVLPLDVYDEDPEPPVYGPSIFAGIGFKTLGGAT